jgi:thermitase
VRPQGTVKVDLAWTGGASTVDVQRQNPESSQFATIATVSNSGSYRDNLGRGPASGTYTYRVCNAGTTTCSNTATAPVP